MKKEKKKKSDFSLLPQRRHLFKSSPLAHALSAIINNKESSEKKGKKRAPLCISLMLCLSVSLSKSLPQIGWKLLIA
jgi:hypothetical protein